MKSWSATTYGIRGARVAAGLLAAGALVAGCGEDGDGRDDPTVIVEDEQVQLAGHTFVAEEVDGHDLVEGSRLSITFDQDAMSVVAGCNTLFGPYDDADGELRWSEEPASTQIGCDEALSEQDDWLRTTLTEGLEIADDDAADLVLEGDGLRIEMTREDGEPSEPPDDAAQYSARLNGPPTAEIGRVVLLTLSNTGDARDSYGFTITPADAGKVRPRHLTVESGRSGKLKVKVLSTPLTIEVESVGAGPGIDTFTIR
ncbi:META domain-containing protein [Nocardioides sp. HM23]|uniref:META domain-containing protein n=1 Tax=Nocardioides bizhenqiangii TaxID=3095076 RepID=UPI002ACA5B72|nr:META domain-containing protein [Nocardioides sp. HM23]MDZ5619892.1 META domain-containing protein [Nocardioides sp. HM23]